MEFISVLLFSILPAISQGFNCGLQQGGIPLLQQKAIGQKFWAYQWGPPPYGSQSDISGVLQIINGGTEAMWIRYAGNGIQEGGQYSWQKYITTPSELNGFSGHDWNALDAHNMTGQGDGFKLGPGEYQIVPFAGQACWFGGSLGCCRYGNNCVLSPNGRGSGQDASPQGQPNTLFEWTAPGVWDCSAVDGFSLPMKVEIDGCGFPYDGSRADCMGSPPIVNLNFTEYYCPNDIRNSEGTYVGCKSMCGCQYNAISLGQSTDPDCPGMASVESIENVPSPPGGYCGCAEGGCVDWLRNFFHHDAAGMNYCDAVKSMAHNATGQREIYCQAYDDDAGLNSYGNGIVKVYLCNNGFETITDRADIC